MNTFQLKRTIADTADKAAYLTAIGLASMMSAEFDVREDGLYFEVPFALSNINLDNWHLVQLAYSSAHQSVIENADLPRVQAGKPVISMIHTSEKGVLRKYYDAFLEFPIIVNEAIEGNDEENETTPVSYTVMIGITNTTASNDYDPFSEATEFIVVNSNLIEGLV